MGRSVLTPGRLSAVAAFLFCFQASRVLADPVTSTQCVHNTSSGSLVFTWDPQPGNQYTVALATGPANSDFQVPVSSGTTALDVNTSGQYNVQFSTNLLFGETGAGVISATGTLPSGATTFAGLSFNTTYYVRARTLWNGTAVFGLEQNASGYILITTTTLPLLPTLT